MVKELSDGITKPNIAKTLKENGHWRKLSMIMVWERYCNASPKPEFFLFSLFIFSFISQLIWVRLGWNFHRWFSIQKQVNWCTIDLFSLKFCTSQHSYPVPLSYNNIQWNLVIKRSDIAKLSCNKVILLVPALYVSLFFLPWYNEKPDINKVIFMVPRTSL